MNKINKKELFSIPNCMGYFRILLIPLFCIEYLSADSPTDYYIASGILLISTITDFLDGQIARRLNMITEFGKFLDPIADKMTHAAIAICLMFRYPYMKYLVLLMLIKEGYMAVMGWIHLKHGTKLDGATWFGKFCTASLFLVLLILVFLPNISEGIATILIIAEMLIMLITLILYIPEFHKMSKLWKD